MMTALLYVYVGGIVLRAVLTHGVVQNPHCEKGSVDGQMIGHILWPVALLLHVVKR